MLNRIRLNFPTAFGLGLGGIASLFLIDHFSGPPAPELQSTTEPIGQMYRKLRVDYLEGSMEVSSQPTPVEYEDGRRVDFYSLEVPDVVLKKDSPGHYTRIPVKRLLQFQYYPQNDEEGRFAAVLWDEKGQMARRWFPNQIDCRIPDSNDLLLHAALTTYRVCP
ncbi:MAG: hypothetical protein HYT76_00120 [Deltaproteobacteria bacterium]|nr:hypothetical protein [Deltaproteobacteria bacterium]